MRRLSFVAVFALAAAALAGTRADAQARFSHLDPGRPATLSEQVPVQFVFVGYEPAQVDQARFLGGLPRTVKPVIRSRLWYGVTEYLGITYTFDYRVTYADAAYENRFFAELSRLAQPAPRTLFQDQYNAQLKNVLDVGQNHFIDAPTVEKWLIDNAPAGVDTRRNTVFFVNWWGRPDFKFHVYTKFGEPDPDTGYDFGRQRESRKIIAWGGTTPDDEETGLGRRGERRVWFYDLSAGPESWTDNWNVDDADVDGDGRADYRMPPAWEYLSAGGYRAASALTSDLGKVARYVAINLLFTPSPLYPPAITPARLPAAINLDLNTYEGMGGVSADGRYQSPGLLVDEVGEVHRIAYSADRQTLPLEGEARQCYQLWLQETPCYSNRPQYPGFANLFLYAALNRDRFTGGSGAGEYEALFFNYAVEDPKAAGFLGYADDNWLDGTQSFTFNFLSPGVIAAGYGLTTTQIHEYGHHFGMSHPHDGYDSETGRDYGPEADLYFAWSGDQVNSMMSYIDLNWDYSQFDRDNANRFQAAAYITNANAIAELILKSANARSAQNDLNKADSAIGRAKSALSAHNYAGAFDEAKAAYEAARAGAEKAGVTVQASSNGWTVLPPVHGGGRAAKRGYAYIDRYAGTRRSAP